MATKRKSAKRHIEYHKDGSIWAKGMMADGVPTGYWEWFRLDGTKMRSGNFDKGRTGRRVDYLRQEGPEVQGHPDETEGEATIVTNELCSIGNATTAAGASDA